MMIEFRTNIKYVPDIEELLSHVYPVMSDLVDTEGAFAENLIPVIACANDVEDGDYFEEGKQFSFYVPFASARPVLVWREEQTMVVRARTLLSGIDFMLALQIVKAFRHFGAVAVVTDDEPDTPVGFDFLEKKFSPSFYQNWARAGLRQMMATCTNDENALFIMPGPYEDFHFGGLLNEVFSHFPDEDQRLGILHEMMFKLNYWALQTDEEDVKIAATAETEEGEMVAYIQLAKPQVVPKADHYCFFDSENVVHLMPRQEFFDRFPPGDQFELMDEFQAKVHISERDILWLKSDSDVVSLASLRAV